VMSPLWYLLGIAVFGGWLGLAVLIAWATGRGAEPKPKRWPPELQAAGDTGPPSPGPQQSEETSGAP
jgi:hypothetical protein